MAFKPGKDAWLMIDGIAGTGVNLTAYADQVSLNQPIDTHDVSEIIIDMPTYGVQLCGSPIDQKRNPTSAVDAQFSGISQDRGNPRMCVLNVEDRVVVGLSGDRFQIEG